MDETSTVALERRIEQQARLVRGLMAAMIDRDDLKPDDPTIIELAEANRSLADLRKGRDAEPAEAVGPKASPMGLMLGLDTTGLQSVTAIKLAPIPTGIYHLLDPATDPLLTVTLKKATHEAKRICVSAWIEGLSAREVRTVELKRSDNDERIINLLPSLFPEKARRVVEVRRCTLRVEVVDLDKKVESEDSHSLVMLARNSSFNAVVDPTTGKSRDLTKYYAAWVTPHVEPVQALVRRAADRVEGRKIYGYQGPPDPEATANQVRALFEELKGMGLAYVDSVIDFGAGPGQVTQRTRLPRESLRHRSANCIDGTVLFASLLECASIHAGIVLVPGHAFVGWETWRGTGHWDYLETTMIGSHDFDAARSRARSLFARFAAAGLGGDDGPIPRVLPLDDLRAQGIWPME